MSTRSIALTMTLSVLVLPACSGSQETTGTTETKLESVEQRASYSIGFNLGQNLKNEAVQADLDLLIQGLRDGLAASDPRLTPEEMNAALGDLQQKTMEGRNQRMAEQSTLNQQQGAAFLAQNAQRPEVKTTASGLQYEVLVEGSGAKPTATSRVRVHYEGTTIDGQVFDSSIQRGEPVTFGLDQVISGWTEGLQMMPVGSKWKLYLPATLAYGANAPPGAAFGPNSVLVFVVELLGIEP